VNCEQYDLDGPSLPRAERDAAMRWLRQNDPVHWGTQTTASGS